MPKPRSDIAPSKPRLRRTAKPAQASRHERIAVAAYYLAEKRGFEPGRELDDWFMAENMLDAGSER